MLNFYIPSTEPDHQYTPEVKQQLMNDIQDALVKRDAVMVSHYYTSSDIQELTELSGGFIGDSLAMAQYGLASKASTLVVNGVKFMGETAKILSPEKTIIMPTLDANCSLDLGCPADEFSRFTEAHPDRTVVVYANTSVKVKALADWVVTSSNAVSIVEHLHAMGQKILWAPDRYLGAYIDSQTDADMVLWDGSCIVHEEFKAKALQDLKLIHPQAAVLVHPESPEAVIAQADVVGSTTKLLQASAKMPQSTFIVATDSGIFYKMRQLSPNKTFILAPTAGRGATCRSCGHCPWMAMNQLDTLARTLTHDKNEVKVESDILARAALSLQRMIDFSA